MKKWWESPTAALGALCGEKAQKEAEEQLAEKMQAEYRRGYEDGKESAVIHAHWVLNDYEDFYCTRCGCTATVEAETWSSDLSDYCPNCGAKMDEQPNTVCDEDGCRIIYPEAGE